MLRRFPWLLLILLIALSVVWMGAAGTRSMVRKSNREEASAGKGSVPDNGEARTRRPAIRAGAAEAKLRSLLEVRVGEMACVRLSPELTGRLEDRIRSGVDPVTRIESGSGAPALGGILNPEMILALFAGTAEEIQGGIDVSDDSFEWRGGRMEVTGTTLHDGEGFVTLDFTATEGGAMLRSTTSVPRGAVVFLRSAGDRPEGLLLAIGGEARAPWPPGDIEQ